ncbi:ECF transporter S component [Bifidobacterium sp. SO4]|uniref:ECF transporter S component n=1 Tax=Bifidobacterium sp. SO4 TaxID=2809030 RepID=UPI001BDC0A31|nr:ECF transporter S component [Bifidobacterium sp. SO4]MBT1171690.1 ECF transporter S component [Bifidobacterium sp. SO4]
MSVSSRIRMQFVRSVAPAAEGAAGSGSTGAVAGSTTAGKLGSHNTGVADSGRWSTRRIAMYALFVALAMVTSFIEFPITPVTWLKYDPSGIVCLIAGFAYGPSAAVIVSVLGFVPHVFADPWGTLMAVLVALCLSVPASLIYRKARTRKGAAIGILAGAVLAIVAAIVGNLIVTPIYAHMTVSAVAAMIVPILLPFNIAKMAIHAVVTFLIYKPISNLLAKQQ